MITRENMGYDKTLSLLHEDDDFINSMMYTALEADLVVGENVKSLNRDMVKRLTTDAFEIFRKYAVTNAHLKKTTIDEYINDIYVTLSKAKRTGNSIIKDSLVGRDGKVPEKYLKTSVNTDWNEKYKKIDINSFPIITRTNLLKIENDYDIEALRKTMLTNPNPKKFFEDIKRKPEFDYKKYLSKIINDVKYDTNVTTSLNGYFKSHSGIKIPVACEIPSIQLMCGELNTIEMGIREYRNAFKDVMSQFNTRLDKLNSLENEYKKIVVSPTVKGANLLTLDISQYYKDLETIKGIQYIYFIATYMSYIADIYIIVLDYYARFFFTVLSSVKSINHVITKFKDLE